MQTGNSNGLRTVVITGANKGIGYSTIEKLLQQQTPYDIILAARNEKLGQEAQAALTQKYPSSTSKVTFRQLDINNSASIDEFVEWIKSARNGKIDILVNNAALGSFKESPQIRLDTLQTNFFSTIKLTDKVLPYLADDGKVINVSSTLGSLSGQKGEAAKALEDPQLTKEKLLELANTLVEKTKEGKHTELGWSEGTYHATKALLNAYTRFVLVKEVKENQQVYTLCPGWCRTDLGGPSATLSAEQGAETPVYLITLPFKRNNDIDGKFIRDSAVISF